MKKVAIGRLSPTSVLFAGANCFCSMAQFVEFVKGEHIKFKTTSPWVGRPRV